MREVQHVNKTEVENKAETQVQNQVKRKRRTNNKSK